MGKKDKADKDKTPSPAKLNRQAYEKELKRLQAELVDLQQWVVETGARVVIIMEGRDAAGKGSAIKRITQYLNPRSARIEALPAPNSREQGQWYFQRYVEKLPTAGEIVIFDRSWYNRAGVERVMGFCSSQEYRRFLHQAPIFERMLVEDGIMIRKYWFSVSDEEQAARFQSRLEDPLRRWKLSPMDLQSITRWEEYSRAKDEMFIHTDIPSAPWFTVESEDKKRSRINVIAHLLSTIPYEKIERPLPEIVDRPGPSGNYQRPPRDEFRYVPDVAAKLERDRQEGKKKSKKSKKDKK
ncbi:polyphosphate kinase 2 [Corynebacterium alimapuense]|uniref:ADP/GDP-polyphosphate phosphotransferase n=1 Tax=Corynebacterium alimapuense TaxID=1576874 RepID=A0A3M8K7N5_9CORY|nr:polyphosphate kinase 2 [Corynebacterium alimapuense]RNE48572.1 polyphosphate kinase 2 [Corynebacterium alimapuense]